MHNNSHSTCRCLRCCRIVNNTYRILMSFSCQNCEKSLEDLGVKVRDLYQEVKSTPASDELPTEIITVVESLSQQHDR